ncbi:arf-GAP with SH3 domain, ANK repeat and PH domain-containing protein 2-like [Oppia nitens]|uniref:arf-GAP with SH3 domain, ANK repeat and PH domain-containing protein 2-like n=1 Tax=Oppia nitens TaxID=1686743 RepID=UPI0023DA11BB|nr:arf-GAP with SH3 domain, ANK repeat and PH domain-containing protein 2-like [Oppia nitens]
MPAALMSVGDFVAETREDINSPTTSSFVSRMSQCRQTVATLEESLDLDRDGLTKMKKALKAIYNGANSHIENEIYLSKSLERLGANAMTKDQEPDIGAAFIKFSIVTKELSSLMKTKMQSLHNIVMFPLESVLKGDLKGVKGDMKKPFDKAWKEYETKITKIEKEKRAQAKEAGLIRTEITGAEVADEMDRERKVFQLQMCDYLIKNNEIKSKIGVELLEHLVEYYNTQTNYFRDALKTIEHFSGYVGELSGKLQKIRVKRDEERKSLHELRTVIRNSVNIADISGGGGGGGGGGHTKDGVNFAANNSMSSSAGAGASKDASNLTGYSLHQMQGNKTFGDQKSGYLLKKSEGKMRVKVWQKRKCEVSDGYLKVFHSDESKVPTKLNLLTVQIKAVPDDRKSFDLISYNRTYHFQTEDESEHEAWVSVLVNSKEGALKREFDNNNQSLGPNSGSTIGGGGGGDQSNCQYYRNHQSLRELQQTIIAEVQRLPGNDRCVDCSSTKDPTWLSTNFGVLTCIECSGIHRDMGVHVSRIQSLTLDNIGTSQLLLARVMSNSNFNDTMEALLDVSTKPTTTSSMDKRNEFIRNKYIHRKYIIKSCRDESELRTELEGAVVSRNLHQLLQVFAEGCDLTSVLPNSANNTAGETGIHYLIAHQHEDSSGNSSISSLNVLDFIIQNSVNLNRVDIDGNTGLHYCVLYHNSEAMKLLLRSNAQLNVRNNQNKTPLDLAKDSHNHLLIELLESASMNKKSLFENVCLDMSFNHFEDPSTDFSDEDLTDDRHTMNYSHPVPIIDRRSSSRPSSVVGSESPSSKSSDSFKPSSSSTTTTTTKQTSFSKLSAQFRNSLKKRIPPPVPPVRDSTISTGTASDNKASGGKPLHQTPNNSSSSFGKTHSRHSSDSMMTTTFKPIVVPPVDQQQQQQQNHWRNYSIDISNNHNNSIGGDGGGGGGGGQTIANIKTTPQSVSVFVSDNKSIGTPPTGGTHHHQLYSSSNAHNNNNNNNYMNNNNKSKAHPLHNRQDISHNNRITNGQSIESLPSISSDECGGGVNTFGGGGGAAHHSSVPVPPPRKKTDGLRHRRCIALYDCDAEREDELAFREGEVIVVVNDITDDDDWMEGMIESEPNRRGVFPVIFVDFIDN